MKRFKWMTRSQAAKKWKMKVQNVSYMVNTGRVDFWEPAEGVILILEDTPRPKILRPWEHTKEKISH